jgi:hypothetical protein
MAPKWYFAQNGKKMGPLLWEELRELSRSGIVSPTTMVLQEGSARWVEARSVFPAACGTESANVNSGSEGAAKRSCDAAAPSSSRSQRSKKSETWVGAGVVAGFIIVAVLLPKNWLNPRPRNKTPDSGSPHARNATFHYWAQVNDILSALAQLPREDAIWGLRQTAIAIQRLPTLNVDLDVVGWSLRVAQVCEQFAACMESSRNPTILLEFFLRAVNNDLTTVPLGLLADDRIAWSNGERVHQEGLRLRATLTARYRTEFPASRF